MRRHPITWRDECDAYEHEGFDIAPEGTCPCDACREARAAVVQWNEYRQPPLVSTGQGSSRRGYTPRPYFGRTEYICIAVIVAFAGWVAVEIWRNW